MADHPLFDIAVIGGGIHGAGVAQAAGYTVALIEKTAWAAGTSSKSSKLIHGGLRYLARGHLGLVRESLRERATLLRIAPHLVRIERFHIPLYRESRLRSWQLIAGLSLYAALGGCGGNNGFSSVPRRCWPAFTGLKPQGLREVWHYWDARTDDSALTRAVAASARQLGAQLFCPTTAVGAEQISGGYQIQLRASGGDVEIRCRVLVNCAGPWVNRIAEAISPAPPRLAIELVQGAHLVLSAPVVEHCYYLESPTDGRAVFLLPWQGKSLLGTTETLFAGDPDEVVPLPQEEAYLLAILRHYFPTATPVVAARMAGLRVLPQSANQPFQRSREVALITDNKYRPSYIAVYGGKLTGYRATAEKVIRLATKNLGPASIRADTATLTLPDGDGSV